MTSLGNQIRYKSQLTNGDYIAREFIQLGNESHAIAKSLATLENKAKSVMDNIINGYEQLEIKLKIEGALSISNRLEGDIMKSQSETIDE